MSTEHEKIVTEINDAFTRNDMQAFLAHCHEDVTWTMVGDATNKGKQTILEWMSSVPDMQPPTFSVTEMISNDDSVVCYGDMTMNDKGKEGDPYSYCDIYHFRDGKVAELRSFVVKLKS